MIIKSQRRWQRSRINARAPSRVPRKIVMVRRPPRQAERRLRWLFKWCLTPWQQRGRSLMSESGSFLPFSRRWLFAFADPSTKQAAEQCQASPESHASLSCVLLSVEIVCLDFHGDRQPQTPRPRTPSLCVTRAVATTWRSMCGRTRVS